MLATNPARLRTLRGLLLAEPGAPPCYLDLDANVIDTVDRVRLVPSNRGLPGRGQWRQGFELIDLDWQSGVDHLLGATRTSTDPALFTCQTSGLLDRAESAGADTNVVASLDLSRGLLPG